jgi:hypothetical protein
LSESPQPEELNRAIKIPHYEAKVAAAFLGVGGADRKGKAIAIYVFPPEKK